MFQTKFLSGDQRRKLITMFRKGYSSPSNPHGYTTIDIENFLSKAHIEVGSSEYNEVIDLQIKYGIPDCCSDCGYRRKFMLTQECMKCIGPRLSDKTWTLKKEKEYLQQTGLSKEAFV